MKHYFPAFIVLPAACGGSGSAPPQPIAVPPPPMTSGSVAPTFVSNGALTMDKHGLGDNIPNANNWALSSHPRAVQVTLYELVNSHVNYTS